MKKVKMVYRVIEVALLAVVLLMGVNDKFRDKVIAKSCEVLIDYDIVEYGDLDSKFQAVIAEDLLMDGKEYKLGTYVGEAVIDDCVDYIDAVTSEEPEVEDYEVEPEEEYVEEVQAEVPVVESHHEGMPEDYRGGLPTNPNPIDSIDLYEMGYEMKLHCSSYQLWENLPFDDVFEAYSIRPSIDDEIDMESLLSTDRDGESAVRIAMAVHATDEQVQEVKDFYGLK